MIKIKTKVLKSEGVITDIGVDCTVKKVEIGEYLAVLYIIKNKVLETTIMDEETLKDFLFRKEGDEKEILFGKEYDENV